MSAAREQARADRARGRRAPQTTAEHEDTLAMDLFSAVTTCRHCGAGVEAAPDQGSLLVHCGTRSRRCAGATTEAEIGVVPF